MIKYFLLITVSLLFILKHLIAFTSVPFFLQSDLSLIEKTYLQKEIILIDVVLIITLATIRIMRNKD